MPPLGLATIAALLPAEFKKKLVDMNVSRLEDKDLLWADYVFISAMISQKDSAVKLIERCKNLGIKTVAGGPLFTGLYEEFPDVDHLVLNEGEITLPMFLEDIKNGTPRRIYSSGIKPDISNLPVPRWDLVKMDKYFKMPVQCSRGCPYDCEFCDIVNLNGRIPRYKEPDRVVAELEALWQLGWNCSMFIVDDNFIGNIPKAKEILKSIIEWRNSKKDCGFIFTTEVTLNLADDDELLMLMREAGFINVFIGIETPSPEGLKECGKHHNSRRNAMECVKKIQNYGIEVSGGFIVGFDSDDPSIFRKQIDFIQNAGIVLAMVSILNALPGTRLYERLKKENRLIKESSGNNTDSSTNFLPKMNHASLVNGYKSIISSIYSPENYFTRIKTFLKHYKPYIREPVNLSGIKMLIKSMFLFGLFKKERKYFWELFFLCLFKHPRAFRKVMTMTAYYEHFRTIFS